MPYHIIIAECVTRLSLDELKGIEAELMQMAYGEHILYVNGEYRGESDLGKLMRDFNRTKADDMNFELMADRTRYLKENPKGVSKMCMIIPKFG